MTPPRAAALTPPTPSPLPAADVALTRITSALAWARAMVAGCKKGESGNGKQLKKARLSPYLALRRALSPAPSAAPSRISPAAPSRPRRAPLAQKVVRRAELEGEGHAFLNHRRAHALVAMAATL